MANRFSRIWQSIFGGENITSNKYNEAFFSWLGGGGAQYDTDGATYVEKGYNINPIVFSVVRQQAITTCSIPYYIRETKLTVAVASTAKVSWPAYIIMASIYLLVVEVSIHRIDIYC